MTEKIISPREIAAKGVFEVLTEEIISPREIAAKGVFEVLTEEIISRGESLCLRTGCSVVRGKWI